MIHEAGIVVLKGVKERDEYVIQEKKKDVIV